LVKSNSHHDRVGRAGEESGVCSAMDMSSHGNCSVEEKGSLLLCITLMQLDLVR
jgi:hypothetical protein